MKQNKVCIGLTGGIASGKSTVTQYLTEKGYPVVDADKIARHIVDVGKPALDEIVEAFGESYLNTDGSLNRKKLGELVFTDKESREILNNITHEKIFCEMLKEIEFLFSDHNIVFADVPLLFESKRTDYYDEIWLVYVTHEVQVNRLVARDKVSENFAKKQIAAQMSLEKKKQLADKVFNNDGGYEELYEKVEKSLEDLHKNIV
jgi:dephospho-CoA kinase